MNSPSKFDRIGSLAFGIGFSFLQFVTTISLATIAGYVLIGGFGGMIAMLGGFKNVLPYLPGVGWGLGGLVGLGNEIARFRRERKATSSSGTANRSQSADVDAETSRSNQVRRMQFRWPGIGQLFKSIGLGGLFGVAAGLAVSVFLCLVLISVTTSPFVPTSWRPKAEAPSSDELDRDRQAGRNREGASMDFSHPLIWPIMFWSGCSMCALGLLGGAAMGFFEDAPGTDRK